MIAIERVRPSNITVIPTAYGSIRSTARACGQNGHAAPHAAPAAWSAAGRGRDRPAPWGPWCPIIDVAAGVGDRRDWVPEGALARRPRLAQLLRERVVAELRQVRMRERVRADLPAHLLQRPQLRPGHPAQLGAVLAGGPVVDPRPFERPAGIAEVGHDEDRAGQPERCHDRERLVEHRRKRVVERDRHRRPGALRRDRLGERDAAVPPREQPLELLAQLRERDRQGGRPAAADRVVAEDERVPLTARGRVHGLSLLRRRTP